MDRSAWRLAINMLEPWSLFLLSPFTFQSTCYLVHFLFPLLFFFVSPTCLGHLLCCCSTCMFNMIKIF
jgi:hypothetical protein